MTSHLNKWGGYRPGSGQKPQWNSGKTSPIRVPEALQETVIWFARLIDSHFPGEFQASEILSCQVRVRKRRNSIKQLSPGPNSGKIREAREVLEKALKLRANAGGGIKKEIRKAIALMSSEG